MAALMTMKGLEATLCDTPAYQSALSAVEAKGGILLRGAMHGFAMPARVTTDPALAIAGAELIAVHVMSDRHEEVARFIAPYLEDGQHILITPGNLGSFIFRQVFDELGITAKVTITEREGNLGPCRLSEPAEVTCGRPFSPKGFVASLPAGDTQEVVEALSNIFDFSAAQNVFSCAMNAGNVIMHICSAILSATAIDRMGRNFSLFKWALTPSVFRVMELVQDERNRINAAAGLPCHKNMVEMAKRISQPERYPENAIFRHIPGGVGTSFSLMFLVVAAALIPIFGVATVMGAVQSVLALVFGMVGSMGALSAVGYVVPGLVIDILTAVTARLSRQAAAMRI